MQTIDNVIHDENVIIFIIHNSNNFSVLVTIYLWVLSYDQNYMHIQEDDCVVSFWFFVKPSSDNQSHLHVLKHWVSVKTFQQWCILDWFFCNVQYKPLHAHMWNPVSLIHLPDYPKISNIPEDQMSWKINLLINRQE